MIFKGVERMSVSLVGVMIGLPIALAMRGVMGSEKFNEWLSASDYPFYTNFKDMNEMKKSVKEAGYDVTEWMGSFKTHLTEQKSSYFLWEVRDDCIVAVMSKYDDQSAIERFKYAVEKTAGRTVFMANNMHEKRDKQILMTEATQVLNDMDDKLTEAKSKKVNLIENEFPTIYVDGKLLKDILQQYHIGILSDSKNKIVCEYDTYKMTFIRMSEEEPFDLKIVSTSENMKLLHGCISDINAEYLANIQEQTYLKIKEQIKEEGMEIEEEKVLEDNSIVLTVSLD